jgi:hypothetical protein
MNRITIHRGRNLLTAALVAAVLTIGATGMAAIAAADMDPTQAQAVDLSSSR